MIKDKNFFKSINYQYKKNQTKRHQSVSINK